MVQLSHPYPTTGNTGSCLIKIQILFSKNDVFVFFLIHCLVLSYLSFQGASLLISRLQSSSAVILEPKKTKFVTAYTFPLSICHKVMGLDAMIFVFECLVLSQIFHSPLSLLSRGSLVSLHFLPLEWSHLNI